jgi:hypothetical protein
MDQLCEHRLREIKPQSIRLDPTTVARLLSCDDGLRQSAP